MYNSEEQSVDLVREYLPSYHSVRFQDQPEPNIAVQDNFLKVTKQHKIALFTYTDIKVVNLRYGGSVDQQLVDIFYTESLRPSPLFVYVHGGYWQMLDKSNSCSIVAPLVRRGYRVAVMDYNNCPKVTLEELVEQFKRFLHWAFDYADQTNTTQIHFAGHSAGAHLLTQLIPLSVSVSEDRRQKVGALIFICGVYDLRELWQLNQINPNNIFNLDGESAKTLSPMLWNWEADSSSWPSVQSHVVTAEHESVTFIEQSRSFANKLKESRYKVMFKVFDSYDHFDIIEDTAIENSPITNYILEALQIALK